MIVEYIRYAVPVERAAAFIDAYGRAGALLDADPRCLRWEITRGSEDPTNFVVRIEWDSLQGHLQGFRASPGFSEFLGAVRPFYNDILEMKHYQRVIPAGPATNTSEFPQTAP